MRPLQSYLQARYGSYKTNPSLCLFNHRGILWAFFCLSAPSQWLCADILKQSDLLVGTFNVWSVFCTWGLCGSAAHPVQKFFEVCWKKKRKTKKNLSRILSEFTIPLKRCHECLGIDINCNVTWRMVMVMWDVTSNRPTGKHLHIAFKEEKFKQKKKQKTEMCSLYGPCDDILFDMETSAESYRDE